MLCRPWLLSRHSKLPPIAYNFQPLQHLKNVATKSTTTHDPIIVPSSSEHHDIPSFLAYASHKGIRETTAYFQGTLYEYTVQAALRRLHFSLTRIGQKGDDGIDLIGRWRVPSYHEPLRVFVQCKAHIRPLSPQHVRELDGTFAYLPEAWRGSGVIGFLASRKRCSRTVKLALQKSQRALAFMCIKVDGTIREFVWNQAARLQGLDGLTISQRFTPGRDPGKVHKDIAIVYNGVIMPYAKEADGSIDGMLDTSQKDVLIGHARSVATHIRNEMRVRAAIAKIEERRLLNQKENTPIVQSWKERKAHIVNTYPARVIPKSEVVEKAKFQPIGIKKEKRKRSYRIDVDSYGFPKSLP